MPDEKQYKTRPRRGKKGREYIHSYARKNRFYTNRFYTSDFASFEKDYSSDEAGQKELWGLLSEEKLYTKDFRSFKEQYYTEESAKKDKEVAPIKKKEGGPSVSGTISQGKLPQEDTAPSVEKKLPLSEEKEEGMFFTKDDKKDQFAGVGVGAEKIEETEPEGLKVGSAEAKPITDDEKKVQKAFINKDRALETHKQRLDAGLIDEPTYNALKTESEKEYTKEVDAIKNPESFSLSAFAYSVAEAAVTRSPIDAADWYSPKEAAGRYDETDKNLTTKDKALKTKQTEAYDKWIVKRNEAKKAGGEKAATSASSKVFKFIDDAPISLGQVTGVVSRALGGFTETENSGVPGFDSDSEIETVISEMDLTDEEVTSVRTYLYQRARGQKLVDDTKEQVSEEMKALGMDTPEVKMQEFQSKMSELYVDKTADAVLDEMSKLQSNSKIADEDYNKEAGTYMASVTSAAEKLRKDLQLKVESGEIKLEDANKILAEKEKEIKGGQTRIYDLYVKRKSKFQKAYLSQSDRLKAVRGEIEAEAAALEKEYGITEEDGKLVFDKEYISKYEGLYSSVMQQNMRDEKVSKDKDWRAMSWTKKFDVSLAKGTIDVADMFGAGVQYFMPGNETVDFTLDKLGAQRESLPEKDFGDFSFLGRITDPDFWVKNIGEQAPLMVPLFKFSHLGFKVGQGLAKQFTMKSALTYGRTHLSLKAQNAV